MFFYLPFWNISFCCLYFYIFRTNFLYMYLEYSFDSPSFPLKSRDIKLLLFFSINAISLTPSPLILLCLKLMHLVHASPFRKVTNSITDLSFNLFPSRLISHIPALERSSAGISPRIFRKNTTSFLLLACSHNIWPIIPPTSHNLFPAKSRVINDLFCPRLFLISSRCYSPSEQFTKANSRKVKLFFIPSFNSLIAFIDSGILSNLSTRNCPLFSIAFPMQAMNYLNLGVSGNVFIFIAMGSPSLLFPRPGDFWFSGSGVPITIFCKGKFIIIPKKGISSGVKAAMSRRS